MFIDYCSGKAAMQALNDIMAHLRDHCGVQRAIKPVAYIKGSDKSVKDRTSGKAEKTSPESSSESDFCMQLSHPIISFVPCAPWFPLSERLQPTSLPRCSNLGLGLGEGRKPSLHLHWAKWPCLPGLWVGNLPSVCTEAEIKALFDRYGPGADPAPSLQGLGYLLPQSRRHNPTRGNAPAVQWSPGGD